jgi:hypothetical protein
MNRRQRLAALNAERAPAADLLLEIAGRESWVRPLVRLSARIVAIP